jgi:pimeloyl-ACP methyl ester carboxylesterase
VYDDSHVTVTAGSITAQRPTVVFVAGAFIDDPTWWWHLVAERLERHGIASRAVQLPSCGPTPPLGDLHDDAAAVRRVVDEIDGPTILVGHSYGGMVITEAGVDHPHVRHLVFMSAFVPEGTCAIGSTFTNPADVLAFEVAITGRSLYARLVAAALKVSEHPRVKPWLKPRMIGLVRGSGRFSYLVEQLLIVANGGNKGSAGEGNTKSYLLKELPSPELVEGSLKRLTRQSVKAGLQRPRGLGWKTVPSTFVVILHDQDVSVERQRRHAERCDHVVEMPTNHFAHLERPDLVCEALVTVALRVMPNERFDLVDGAPSVVVASEQPKHQAS